jgi:hypothetical protein
MRQLPFISAHFRAAVLLDAFGFFEQEEEHVLVLRELARVLAPGGRAALKVVNAAPIIADFRASDRQERDGTVVTISRTLENRPARLIENISTPAHRGRALSSDGSGYTKGTSYVRL